MTIAQRILFILCFILIGAFSIKNTTEPDLWWQLTTGEWIVQHGEVPKVDFLSFTFKGEPWVNIKWGAEVIFYFVAKAISPEFIAFFVGMLYMLLFYFLYRMMHSRKGFELNNAFGFAALLFILTISHRINGRPEVFSYLLTGLYLWIFYISKNRAKWLYALIPLQLIWTNLHEGFGIGIVMMGIFAISDFIEHRKINIQLFSILLLALAAMMLNPIGVKIYPYAINIFTQLQTNTFTTELSSFKQAEYWNTFAYLNVLGFVLSGFYLVKTYLNTKGKAFWTIVPAFHLILFFAFFYLSLQSNRNIVYFQLAALPLYYASLHAGKVKQLYLSIAAMCFIYLLVVSNKFYERYDENNTFGLEIPPAKNPIGAVDFINQHLKGKKGFSDFFVSNYALWAGRPHFKSFLDLRDLDIFTAAAYKNSLYLLQNPTMMVSPTQTIWQLADSADHYDYVLLLNREEFIPMQQFLWSDTSFKMVYADPLASVYMRQGNAYLLNKKPIWHSYQYIPNHALSNAINKLFNPFYTPIADGEVNDAYYRESLENAIGVKIP